MNGLAALLGVLTNGVSGYVQQKNKNQEFANQKSILDLQKQQAAVQNLQHGVDIDPATGGPVPRKDFMGEDANYFDAQNRRAYQQKVGPEAPIESIIDPNILQGSGVMPGTKLPASYSHDIIKERLKVKPQANPEQVNQYEAAFGKGTSAGLTPAQLMNGIAVSGNRQATQQRFEVSQDRASKQHSEDLGFRKSQAYRQEKNQVNQDTRLLAKAIQDQGLPESAKAIETIDKETGLFSSNKPDLSKFQSTGESFAGSIPLIGPGIQSRMAEKSGGQSKVKVMQARQSLFNAAQKAISGGSVTAGEDVRNRIAQGMAPGASPEVQADGLKAAYEALLSQEANTIAGYSPEAVAEHRKRGGYKPLSERIGKKSVLDVVPKKDAGAMSFEEWKKANGRK